MTLGRGHSREGRDIMISRHKTIRRPTHQAVEQTLAPQKPQGGENENLIGDRIENRAKI